MQEIIEILMRRDGISYADAKEAYLDCRTAIMDAIENGEYEEVEYILMSELGIEPDYIFDFVY